MGISWIKDISVMREIYRTNWHVLFFYGEAFFICFVTNREELSTILTEEGNGL